MTRPAQLSAEVALECMRMLINSGVPVKAETTVAEIATLWGMVGLTDQTAPVAVLAYVAKPTNPGWALPWPSPGQLLASITPTSAGGADLAWASLQERRGQGRASPDDPTLTGWRLASSMGAEWCRVIVVSRMGGWVPFAQAALEGSVSVADVEAGLHSARSWIDAYDASGATTEARLRMLSRDRSTGLPSWAVDRARSAARVYAETADPRAELAELTRLARVHGEQRPDQPATHERWTLHQDRAKAVILWRAIQAAGGWHAIPSAAAEGVMEDGERIDAAQRKAAFRRALEGEKERTAQAERIKAPARVAGLVAGVVDGMRRLEG